MTMQTQKYSIHQPLNESLLEDIRKHIAVIGKENQ